MCRITDIIVFGDISERDTILTDKFQQTCTNEELHELYNTLYGWTTLAWYSKEYKAKLRKGMKNIDNILKSRNIKKKIS